MGELQWALLIVCVGMVVALYVLSRRGKNGTSDHDDSDSLLPPREHGGDQLDLLAPRSDAGYDEYGVGRKRKRGDGQPDGAPQPVREPPAPSMATLLNPLPGQTPVSPRVPQEAPPATAAVPLSTKMVALIIAPTEEIDLQGPQLHAALAAQGLRFGEGEVYHRSIGGRAVFSVASLIKPGKLIPADADSFSTKGLTVVMNLPGPVTPAVALDDMLVTTRALASALKAEIFDARRQRLTDEVASALKDEINDWARARKLS